MVVVPAILFLSDLPKTDEDLNVVTNFKPINKKNIVVPAILDAGLFVEIITDSAIAENDAMLIKITIKPLFIIKLPPLHSFKIW